MKILVRKGGHSMGTVLKDATKEWAKEYWLLTPWNMLAFFSTLALTKWLIEVLGAIAYGSTLGNFKLAGVMLLAATVAAFFVLIGSGLFKVNKEKQTDVFWWAGVWIPIGIAGCATFLGRAALILVGIIKPGTAPPEFLQWLFDPFTLGILKELGNP
jgi:hypothetical protein